MCRLKVDTNISLCIPADNGPHYFHASLAPTRRRVALRPFRKAPEFPFSLSRRRLIADQCRPIEPHGVFHQQLSLQLLAGRDAGNHVDKFSVVGNSILPMWMRPVRAPQTAVGVVSNQRRNGSGKRVPGGSGGIKPVRTARFEPPSDLHQTSFCSTCLETAIDTTIYSQPVSKRETLVKPIVEPSCAYPS